MAAFFSLTRTVFGFALFGPLTDPLTVTTLTEVEVSTTDEDTATPPPAPFLTKNRHNLSYKLERKLLKKENRFEIFKLAFTMILLHSTLQTLYFHKRTNFKT